ncbi:MAG: hypothetical protein ACQEQD_01860 [Bacillota bacterium]
MNISPLLPTIIIFIVGVNLIESLIKFLIGRNKNNDKQAKKENGKESKRKKIFNANWSLKNKSEENEISNEKISTSEKSTDIEEDYFRNKKGRMADFMDNKETSIYENKNKTNVKRRKTVSKDFPNEIKIGENSLFDKENIKGDILKGIVMKEILDKPRAMKPYKTSYKKNN